MTVELACSQLSSNGEELGRQNSVRGSARVERTLNKGREFHFQRQGSREGATLQETQARHRWILSCFDQSGPI